ncbi:hypothetical protein O6P43_010807 [Quillaja saponaria]|uniref:Uncharacterized protein n=1 Tax=Quillaja saponaria TaxID=32244 RepID=A0AAD7VER9_QUISA|nr:hypothetical protein O6P43_010807 [Quillaja saponaria]
MARSNDLAKVGMEGFTLLEEWMGRKPKAPVHHQVGHSTSTVLNQHQYYPSHAQSVIHHQVHQTKVHRYTTRDQPSMDSYQAAQMYGGVMFVDYGSKKMIMPQRQKLY